MRVLLDEDLDIRLRDYFGPEHEVVTVAYRGWKGLKNGQLLSAAQNEFDALVTSDSHLPDQHNLSQFQVAVVILRPKSKALNDLVELMPQVEAVLPSLRPGDLVRIYPSDPSNR